MDTIYAEGQRRYVESLSSYARQFVGQMQKPQVGPHRGPLAGHRHRAEARRPLAAQHGRHGHRDLRLSADPRVAARPAVLPGVRRADRHAVGRRDHRQDHGPAGRHEALPDGPAGNPTSASSTRRCGKRSARRATCAMRDRRPDALARPAAADRPPAEARRRGGHRPRRRSRRRPLAASPAAWRTPWRWAAACCAWPIRATTCRSRAWPVEVHSQHFACDRCGRSFEPLSPHNFSFNSPLGWCPACEGLGRADGHESGGVAARSEAHARRRRGRPCGPAASNGLFAPNAGGLRPGDGHSDRRALRATRRQAPPADHARHRRAVVRR